MADENWPAIDLWGDPWSPPRDPRGRRRHRRCPQVAEKVAVLRASGLKVEEVALRLGLSEPTLRKYYFRELEHAVALARSVVLEAMFTKAQKGVVSAGRFVFAEFEKGEVAVPVSRRPAAQGPKPEPAEKLGKKAAADRDAQTAHEDTEWAEILH